MDDGKAEKETDDANRNRSIEDIDRSDRSSNISGSSVNEDLRQLKDFKALVSEKTVPKSIRTLKRTVIILLLILVGLASIYYIIMTECNSH